MDILNVLVCLTTLYGISHGQNVHYMEMETEHAVSKSFGWKNCDKSGPMQIKKFILNPDPLKEGSMGDISFSMDVAEDIESPIKMKLSIQVLVPGEKWVEVCTMIPYLDQCTMTDLCQTLRLIQNCPPILTKQGFDCTCPIKKGKYGTPNKMEFKIPTLPISGNVKIHLELSKALDNGAVGCVDVVMKLD